MSTAAVATPEEPAPTTGPATDHGAGVDAGAPGAKAPAPWELTPKAFRLTFTPTPGVDYGWVVAHAKDEYARAVELYRKLDDKAAAVANYLGAGSGLLTLGAVAGVAGGQIGVWTVLAALPSVGLALSALVAATIARLTSPRPAPPGITHAVGYAEFKEDQGEAAFLGPWHETLSLFGPVIARKARRVDRAIKLFAAAVTALALPLAVVVARKAAGLAP